MKTPFLKSPILWVVLVACVVVAAWAWRSEGGEKPAEAPPARPMLVRTANRLFVPEDSPLRARLAVAAANEEGSAHNVSLPAVVEADPATTVSILPPATGRVAALKVRLGDVVKRGQVLATISSGDFAQAVSDTQKARDALDLARRTLTRARGVNEAGSNATKDVEAAESAVIQETAELRRSEARLSSLNAGITARPSKAGGPAMLDVMAPVSGSVATLNTAAGAVLNDASAAIMTVANLDHVWITANVPEGLIGTVATGQDVAVVVAAYPRQVLSGKVAFVGTVLDADTRRIKARIAFPNPQGLLKPNMFATARFAVPQAPQPVVPTSALLMNNDSTTVFVEVDPWTFVRRSVELGSEDGGQVRVRSGLQAGERIVIRGGVLLND